MTDDQKCADLRILAGRMIRAAMAADAKPPAILAEYLAELEAMKARWKSWARLVT